MSKEDRAAYSREWHLRRKFDISGEDYAALLKAQSGVCATCKQPETHHYPSGKLKELAVDHDHETGTVRGLLCFNCNQGIGRFQDNPSLLRAAADYLERHRPKVIPGLQLLATLPDGLGAVTGLRVQDGALVCKTEAGVDYVVTASVLKTCTPPIDAA